VILLKNKLLEHLVEEDPKDFLAKSYPVIMRYIRKK
jgi:hypothetical protein